MKNISQQQHKNIKSLIVIILLSIAMLMACNLQRIFAAYGDIERDPIDEVHEQLDQAQQTHEAEIPIPNIDELGVVDLPADSGQSSDSNWNSASESSCTLSGLLVIPGDIRQNQCDKPEHVVYANIDYVTAPEWVTITHSEEAWQINNYLICLYQEGQWIQATTSQPVSMVGVQFDSDYAGWARVLVNGTEIYRGNLLDFRNESTDKMWVYFRTPINLPAPVTIYIEDLGQQTSQYKYWIPIFFFGFDTP